MIIELEQKNMEQIKELANTTLKISEAKNIISKLQETETEYLIEREKKALAKISQVLSDSQELLDQTKGNYEEVHQFCQKITEYASFISEAHTKFSGLLEDFEEKNKLWDKQVEQKEKNLQEVKNKIIIDKEILENGNKALKSAFIKLGEQQRKLESDRGSINRKIIRLNEGRI